jgi:hypothetical protein
VATYVTNSSRVQAAVTSRRGRGMSYVALGLGIVALAASGRMGHSGASEVIGAIGFVVLIVALPLQLYGRHRR